MLTLEQAKRKIIQANMKPIKTVSLFIAIFISLLLLSQKNFPLFHFLAELTGVLVTFAISVIAYNTYHLSQKNILTYLGISYFFVYIFCVLHILTFKNMGLFKESSENLSAYFSNFSKYLECFSLLMLPIVIADKKAMASKPRSTIIIYLLISIALTLLAVVCNPFWKMVNGDEVAFLKRVNELIIAVIFTFMLILLIISKSMVKFQKIYKYIILLLLSKILSQFFFVIYHDITDVYNGIAHIFRLISFYFIYKILVETNLRRSFKHLFTNLNEANMELEKRTLQLQDANKKLILENLERKQVETRLSQSKGRYKLLLELLPEGLFVQNEGRITFSNTSALKLLGAVNLSEIIGKPIQNFIPEYLHEVMKKRIWEVQETGRIVPLSEEQFLRVDGTIVDVEVLAAPFIDNGETSVLIIARDITSRKKTEELKRRIYEKNVLLNKTIEMDRIKTEFFSNISHELRTPLNVILSTIQLSTKYLESDLFIDNGNRMSKHFNIMNQNCRRLLRLINNLIDVTKIDAGFLEPCMRNCNIISIIEDITLSVAPYIESNDISLVFDTDTEEKILACDPEKIERILLNLLSNATKFTKPGGLISVKVFDKKTSIMISVEDTGIGVPLEDQKEIFDRFKQVDQSLTRNHEGSGIGLSLVKSLVQMHNGTISLESELGKGSNFMIELPANILEDSDTIVINEGNADPDSRIERVKVEFSDIYRNT